MTGTHDRIDLSVTLTTGAEAARALVGEPGFASVPVAVEEQVAQHAQDTTTRRHQLELVRRRLEEG